MILKKGVLWGIYLGLTLSMGTQILTWLGLGLSNWFLVLNFVAVIVFVALGLHQTKRSNDKQLKLGHVIVWVLFVILISRYIFQAYMFLYIHYVEPGWIDEVADIWTKQLQESNTGAEQIEKMIDGFRKSYETLPMFTIEIVKYGLSQFVLGVFVSLFFVFNIWKKRR